MGHEPSIARVPSEEPPSSSDGDSTVPSPCLSVAGCASSTTESSGGTPLPRSPSPLHERAQGKIHHSPPAATNASKTRRQPDRSISSWQFRRRNHCENDVSRNGSDRQYLEVDDSPRSGGWPWANDGGVDCSSSDGSDVNGAELARAPQGAFSDLVFEPKVIGTGGKTRSMSNRKGEVQHHADVMAIDIKCVSGFSDECDNSNQRLDDGELPMRGGECSQKVIFNDCARRCGTSFQPISQARSARKVQFFSSKQRSPYRSRFTLNS